VSIVIDKNIPTPTNNRAEGITKALRSLEIGDSFVIPPEWSFTSVRAKAYTFKGRKFTIRKNGEGAVRVWRIPLGEDTSDLA
jgi:hypothetical protein